MRDPELVVGDGAMGLRRALADALPQARHRRCWVYKTGNVVNALLKSAQPGAKKALQEIYNAEDGDHTDKAVKDFGRAYGAKWPKAVKQITDAVDELLAFEEQRPPRRAPCSRLQAVGQSKPGSQRREEEGQKSQGQGATAGKGHGTAQQSGGIGGSVDTSEQTGRCSYERAEETDDGQKQGQQDQMNR
jgi:hypothetical protein